MLIHILSIAQLLMVSPSVETSIELTTVETVEMTTDTIAVDKYPISQMDLGTFPFLKAPEKSQYINNIKVINFDANVVITESGIYEVEGKVFRAWVHKSRDVAEDISNRYLIKGFEEQITRLGGVKIFEGSLSGEKLKQYNNMVSYGGDDGSFIPTGDSKAVTYIIRHDSGNVFITLEKRGFGSTSVQIVQEEPKEKK